MAPECYHLVGYIPGGEVSAEAWNEKMMAFVAKVDDVNVHSQRDQINHPGFVADFKYGPNCGHATDRAGLGVLTYVEAFKRHEATKAAS